MHNRCRRLKLLLCILLVIAAGTVIVAVLLAKKDIPKKIKDGYALYVWEKGWDNSVHRCDNKAFLAWDEILDTRCFTHNWNTTSTRDWLFSTCKRKGREITTIFLYGMHDKFVLMQCETEDVKYIRETIKMGKMTINRFEVYALLSFGGEDLPEKDWVKYFVWYNTNCAADESERVDGIAVYNGNYERTWKINKKNTYLNNLKVIADEAAKQFPLGSFKTHFSVGWIWGKDSDNNEIKVKWNGRTKYIIHHLIDIFDTIDVQVAFVTSEEMVKRLEVAGTDYSDKVGKQMHVNVNTNKDYPCQTTFFPYPANASNCPPWSHQYKTEEGMFTELDKLQLSLPNVRVALHFFRGAYSSGGFTGWPAYNSNITGVNQSHVQL